MSLHLYDSARASVREFEPLQPGRAGIYVCGATPQAGPHIGHVRSQVSFDVLRRWLTRSGYDVTYVRNVTDIDDKILARAETTGQPWWALALQFEREFEAAYAALNVLPPTYTPGPPVTSRRWSSSSSAWSTPVTPTRRRTARATCTSTSGPGPPTAS